MSMSDLIVPPHSYEAECGVLGTLLLDNDAIHRIGDLNAIAQYALRRCLRGILSNVKCGFTAGGL